MSRQRSGVTADIIECWCGAKGEEHQLFDESGLDESCAGTGFLNCFCGGDLCVCHHHSEIACPGCDDCGYDDDDAHEPDDYEPVFGGCG